MRGRPRWLAVLSVVAIAAIVCAFTAHRATAPALLVAQLSQSTLPADGFSSTELTLRTANGHDLRDVQVEIETPHRIAIESISVAGGTARVSLRSGVIPGDSKLRVSAAGDAPQQIALTMTPDYGDSVGDGTPDFLRLHDPADRLAFRQWFTLLAESQYYREKPEPEVDDCAALLRFAYREALRQHDAAWAHATALPAPSAAGDIHQYQYPYTSLGPALFRVRGDRFTADDLRDGAFAEFADAETLWRHNTFAVGRDVARARPADLLFFRQNSGGGKATFHAMIFVGRSQVEPSSEEFVVYHTGPTPDRANHGRAGDPEPDGSSSGRIKRLSVSELLNYPDPRWRPLASNPAFLGVYRWNILRGAE